MKRPPVGCLTLLGLTVLAITATPPIRTAQTTAQTGAQVDVLGPDGSALAGLTDGDRIQLRVQLLAPAASATAVVFTLDGLETEVAGCPIAAGATECGTAAFLALGWFWENGGRARPERAVEARIDGALAGAALIRVAPRPVVMVHGFISDWEAWQAYLGPEGFLASIRLSGYAVGDGQVPGSLNTGRREEPTGRTNTMLENAAILGQYIARVRQQTGAQQVDLLVHSMGGMISRAYIDRLMPERDVAQLIILGTPMAGSDCAILPAALDFYLPASLEIQPAYMVGVFNRQFVRRHGVPFYAIAGTQITEAVQSPCTATPSDIVVARASVAAIPMPVSEVPLLHSDLARSPEVFASFVRPLLQAEPGNWSVVADPPAGAVAPDEEQFSRVFTGRVDAGGRETVVVPIDPQVAVANFALYDPTRSLDVTVRGASGRVIELDPVTNGLLRIEDPATMLYLGYGFNNPAPGAWEVTLNATPTTPPGGADFALSARFTGGARLDATTNLTVPRPGDSVTVSAVWRPGGQALEVTEAQLIVRAPDGARETMPLTPAGPGYEAAFVPDQAGLYGLEVRLSAVTAGGFAVDRTAWLAVTAEASRSTPLGIWLVSGLCLVFLAGVVMGTMLIVVRRRRVRHA